MRPEADYSSDHELLIAKFRLKLKKVGKATRPYSSVQFSCSVVSDSLRPHESQHARPPCPSPTGQYQNQTDYILCNQRWRSSIELAKTRPGTDCDFVHEHACVLSQFFATLWTIVCQTPLPMGFSRQEYWSGLLYCKIQACIEESKENN